MAADRMTGGFVMEPQTDCFAKSSTTPPIAVHSFLPTFTGSSSPSCSSANSLPYVSEAVGEADGDDLFWSASTDSKQRSDSFSTSSTGPIRGYDDGDFDVQSHGSPTKTGGIHIELTLFSDDEEDAYVSDFEGVITYQQGEESSRRGLLQRQKRSQRISRMSPMLTDSTENNSLDRHEVPDKQQDITLQPRLLPSFVEVDMFDDDETSWSPRGNNNHQSLGTEEIGKNLQVPDAYARQGRSAELHGSHSSTMSTSSCSQPSSPALAETPQLLCTETNARPASPTDPVLAEHCNRTSTSSDDISLCTPYSPTALSEFDFIAKTFPLPLDRDQQGEAAGKVIRDGVADFPIGIPLPGEETEVIVEADSSGSDSLHGSQSCAREDLTHWRSQCHLSGTSQSTISLPTTLTILPPSTLQRNCSVISLPTSLPDLTNSTATSTTFNWSATCDSDWHNVSSQPTSQPSTMMKRDCRSQRGEREPDHFAQDLNVSEAADHRSSFFSDQQYVITTSDLSKGGLASPLTFPAVAGSISYASQPLPLVPEESPSKMDSSTSPLFTMSPMRPDDSPAAHSAYSGRIMSTATSNKLTYIKSQIVSIDAARPLSVPSSINSSPGRTLSSLPPTTAGSNGSSTFGIHRTYLVPDTSTKGLGLIHENDERKSNTDQQKCQTYLQDASRSPSSVGSFTNRRKKRRMDLQELWGSQRIPSTPPPPQGPLPQPGGPIDEGYSAMRASGPTAVMHDFDNRVNGKQQSIRTENSDTQLKEGNEYRFSGISVSVGPYPRSPKSAPTATSSLTEEEDEDHDDKLRQAPDALSPLDSVRDITKSRSTSSFCSSNPSAGDSAEVYHQSNPQNSLPHTPRDFAWGVHGAKQQRSSLSRDRSAAFASSSLTYNQSIQSASFSTASARTNGTSIQESPATDLDPELLQTSWTETAFTHPYAASRVLSRSDPTNRTTKAAINGMTTPISDVSNDRLRSPLTMANAFAKDPTHALDAGISRYEPGQPSVVSQESSRDPDEDTCPICVESLSASYRLPGERAHIVPECRHALHEACFVEVYGPVPVSYTARQRELGVCGICRAPMRLVDEDDMPRSSSKMGGGNKFAAMMGLGTEGTGDKGDNRMRGGVNPSNFARRPPLPTSSSTTSFSSSMHHVEGSGDDPLELEGTSLPSARIQHSVNTGVVIPAISVKSEFTALSRKSERNAKQTVTCLVTVQVPHAGPRESYPAPTVTQTPSKSSSTERLTAGAITHRKESQDATFTATSPASPNIGHPGADNFSHIAADLKSRMTDYKASGIDNLGRIRLFDILRVRKGAFVLDISVYLFQHALVCVTEEKKKGLRGFLNSPSSYSSLRHPTAERGGKKEKGVLKLKGRIYFKHVKRVLDTSIAGDLSLTITMEDERMDSFILTFRDKDSMDLWRRTLIEAVQEIKADQQPRPTSPMSPPTSASGSITSKLTKMGFNDTVLNITQSPTNNPSSPQLQGMKMPGKPTIGDSAEMSRSVSESACLPPPLLPVHTPIDLLIVRAIPNALTAGTQAVHKVRPIKAAFNHACQSLGPRDRLSLVTYEHGMGGSIRKTHFFSPGRVEGRRKLEKFISGIACRPEGAKDTDSDEFTVVIDKEAKTDMISGVNVGLDTVLQRRAKNPLTAVVLINDNGDVVKRASMDLVLARAEAANVAIHTVGYGKHQDSSGLWLLSSHTHGTYTFVREWYHLQDCLTGLLGGMASVALTKFNLRLEALDTDFRCRKISGAPHAVLSGDGKHVDIELKELQFGQKIEVLVEMEYETASIPVAGVLETQQAGGDSDEQESRSNEGHTPVGTVKQVQKDSKFTDESYGISGTENLLEMSNARLEDDIPVFEVDCTYQDPASNRSVARLSHPILLTIATAPPASNTSYKAPWADFEVARRRYELVSSESISRALLLVSRQKWTQAQRVLQETTKILSAVIRNTVDLIAIGTGTRAAVRREMQALVLLDSLRAIIEDIDVLIEGMEEERDAFERDHRNFGAQQALILRTQRSWTARTHTEGMYITEGSKEALLKR